MDLHVNNITRSCFYQLRQLRSIRRSLTMEASKTLVHSLKSRCVDYCNSIFYGATNAVLQRLQSVLNAAARLITNTRKFDHITPVLRNQLYLSSCDSIYSYFNMFSLTYGASPAVYYYYYYYYPPTHHFQNCILCLKLVPWP